MISTLLGTALLGLLFVDVFYTVFHPEGYGGPIHRRQNRGVWSVFRWLGARRDGGYRDGLLALAGPVLAVLTLVSWALLLIVSFALIYYPRASSLIVSPGSISLDWVGVLYYSGSTVVTLGMGDVVANTPGLRILTVLEALSGFALVSVSVAYLISVYREQGMAESLAMEIDACFRGRVDELSHLADPTQVDAVARRLERFTAGLFHLLQAYARYPILHFFRPRQESAALAVQLRYLLEFTRSVERSDPARGAAALRAHPSYPPLRRALQTYLAVVDRHLSPPGDDGEEAGTETGSARRHERLLRYMGYRAIL